MRRKLYSRAKNLSKIRSSLDTLEVRSIQNEYIRNADITPIWEDIRNAYMNELYEIARISTKKFGRGICEYIWVTSYGDRKHNKWF